jgi:DNA modification methylase
MVARRASRVQTQFVTGNRLYNGDNLAVLRGGELAPESVDLIYLDPPFKSNKNYNTVFKEKSGRRSTAQEQVFLDTWTWNQAAMNAFHDSLDTAPWPVVQTLQAMRSMLGEGEILAYLAMMAPRLVELHRVLKDTGSLYLHCDPTSSHYLRALLDAVFGKTNFLNEVIWHYRKWPTGKYKFQRNHDVLFFYSKSESKERTFNQLYMDRTPSTLKRFGEAKIMSAHDPATGLRVPSKMEAGKSKGVRQDDVWAIGRVPPIKQRFPTEKPAKLLERIIEASSNEGDVILDPFCGCGTTVVTAHAMKRTWIGIDIAGIAMDVIRDRLEEDFGKEVHDSYEYIPKPVTAEDARRLKDAPYLFQWWSLDQVGAQPAPKRKGADKGIDGRIYFREKDEAGKIGAQQVVISVKAGHTGPAHVRELVGVVKRENAAIGVLITLRKPTKAMYQEAASHEPYHSPTWEENYPKIQIVTVEDLMSSKPIDYPAKLPSAAPITEDDMTRLRTSLESTP